MAYTVQAWNDGPSGGTPVTAARLAHIEAGIAANDDAIANVQVGGGTGGNGVGAVWGTNLDASGLTDGTSIYQFAVEPGV